MNLRCLFGLHTWKPVWRFEPTELFCYGDPDWVQAGKKCQRCGKVVRPRWSGSGDGKEG